MNNKNKFFMILIIFTFNSLIFGKTNGNYENMIEANANSSNRVEIFEKLLNDIVSGIYNTTEVDNLIDDFISEQEPFGFPIIFNNTVYFIHKVSVSIFSTVYVAGDFNGWNSPDPDYKMNNIPNTDLFYLKKQYELDARLDYKFIVGSNWIIDPRNNRTVSGGFGPNSELVMPKYSDDGSFNFRTTEGGEIITLNNFISTTQDNWTRDIKVYLPPGYNENGTIRYKTFYTSDGSEYVNLGSAKNVLDYLILNELTEPLIGVFINPVSKNWRLEEYNGRNCDVVLDPINNPDKKNICRQKYAEFVANELVPFIDSNYLTENDSRYRAHIGDSLGGIISVYVASQYPQVFKLVGSHSGAFWADISVVDYFNKTEKIESLRFYLNAGTYEPSILQGTQRLVKILEQKGYSAKFRVFHQGHSWGLWRSTLAEMLIFLFTGEASGFSGSPALASERIINSSIPNVQSKDAQSKDDNRTTNSNFTVSLIAFVLISVYYLNIRKRKTRKF